MIVLSLLKLVVYLFLICLIGRLVFDWIQVFARDFRPRGVVLVAAEGVYSATDPVLKPVRRLIPPVRLGSVQLDLSFLVVFFVASLLLRLIPG